MHTEADECKDPFLHAGDFKTEYKKNQTDTAA
jgi:hypothetical protein